MGVPLRGPRGAAAGAGLQGDPAAAELAGAVGGLAGRRREPGAQALPGQRRLPQGRQALPPQVVLLQVRSGSAGGPRGRGRGLGRLLLSGAGQRGITEATPPRGKWGPRRPPSSASLGRRIAFTKAEALSAVGGAKPLSSHDGRAWEASAGRGSWVCWRAGASRPGGRAGGAPGLMASSPPPPTAPW